MSTGRGFRNPGTPPCDGGRRGRLPRDVEEGHPLTVRTGAFVTRIVFADEKDEDADDDEMAVLDASFRLRGATGIRVVDASCFPKIPGFFIVVPVYMLAEKATDVVLASLGEQRG